MSEWKYWTPERDGHAPDDWDGGEVQFISGVAGCWVSAEPLWGDSCKYRYHAKPCLQDATYEPDLLAQCLALPQDQREALIEAMQKPQEPERDWAEEVWDRAYNAYFTAEPNCLSDEAAFEAIRSMCRPKEELQHVAYYDEGQFHWMSGIAPRDCELFAKRKDCA